MRRRHGKRARLGGVLLAALGALALLALPSLAAAKDRNHDRIPDRWEKRHHLSLKVNQAARDQDRDHLEQPRRVPGGRQPARPRTATTTASWTATRTPARSPRSTPDTGQLTINLFGGDTVSGIVTDDTRDPVRHECSGHDGDDSRASASARGRGQLGPRELGTTTPARLRPDRRPRPTGRGRPRRRRRRRQGEDDQTTTTRPTARPRTWSSARWSTRPSWSSSNGVATFEEIELEQTRAPPQAYLASSQSWPTPTSTSSGGSSW